MTSFAPDLHPRVADGTFTNKPQTAPGFTLTDEQTPVAWVVQNTPAELVAARSSIEATRAAAAAAEQAFEAQLAVATRAFATDRWPSASAILFAVNSDYPTSQVSFVSVVDGDGGTIADNTDRETSLAVKRYSELFVNPYSEGGLLDQADAYGDLWSFELNPED